MTTQTITATKPQENTRSYALNYLTGRAVIITVNGTSKVSLDAAMAELHELPEQGWTCK